MGRSRQSNNERRRRFEQFEQRLVMSAQGISAAAPDIDQLIEELVPATVDSSLVDSVNDSSSSTAEAYGFDGSGQTIAVIDSGIAWDHAALGSGYGAGNKVVGGWDFAENDSNPYDDGPAGFHGTHVAGIAAGNGNGFKGVASGADLVGLRVFNDQGIGKIEWVESALQWVRNNLDSFENPITTVNMSLGADWNTETISDWNVISDELASLKSEGVFISVAAGNDFKDFFSKTLSHPAANKSVVAVASHDANNQLSDFSQRDDHVLVAPGEDIRSSVPNYLFGTRKVDQLLGASGTSMAAPYVAGASAVLRNAYAYMGYGEVDQNTLYETFWETSNQIYDSITQTTFQQLDLDAAIQSIVGSANPVSGDTVTQIGTINGGEMIRGTIAAAGDVDQFQFISASDGQIELTLETTEQLEPTLEVTNSLGQQVNLQFDGDRVYIHVIAGESYGLEVSSDSGTGHYQISTQFQQSASATELGIIESIEVTDFISSERTYSLTASKTGPMAFGFATDSPFGKIEVYDSAMNRLTSQQVVNGRTDFQFDVTEGESLFVLLEADGEVEFSAENLVSIENGTLTVNGTEKVDSFVINDGNSLDVEVNGTRYRFQQADVSSVMIHGDATMDKLELNLSDRYERTILRQNRVDAFDGSKTLRAVGFQTIDAKGSGVLTVAGSEADDKIHGNYEHMSITSGDARATGHGYDMVIADGKGGYNSIEFIGDAGNDILFSKNDYSVLRNGEASLVAINYQRLDIDGSGGHDITNLFGSELDDQLTLGADLIEVSNDRTNLSATGFERATAFNGNGNDAVVFSDSQGNDRFLFANGTSQLVTDSTHLVAHQFSNVTVSSTGGYDVAQISGTVGNEHLDASRDRTVLQSENTNIEMNQFDRVNVVANFQGYDTGTFNGSQGSDQFIVDSNSASVVFDGGSIVRTVGFVDVSFDGASGHDMSFLNGTESADVLDVNHERTVFRTGNVRTVARGVESTHFDGHGGGDAVYVDDVQTLDVVALMGDRAIAVLENHRIEAEGFDFLEATAVEGAIAAYDMERVDFQSVLRGQWQPQH